MTFDVTVPKPVCTISSIDGQTVKVSKSKTVSLSATCDPPADTLTYTATSSDTAKATASVSGSTLTVTGVAAGTATVTVTVTDGRGGSDTETLDVTVEPLNEPPDCSNISVPTLWVNDSTTVDLSPYCSDPDGDNLTYSASSSSTSKVTVSVTNYPNSNRGTLTLTGKAIGSSTITVTASDGSLSTTKTPTATVKNRDPDCVFSAQTINVGDSTDMGVNAHCTDADGHSMTFTSASSADTSIATVSRPNSNATVRIQGVAGGTTKVTVTVSDGNGGSTTKEFDVTVLPSCGLTDIGNQTIEKGKSRELGLSSDCNGTYSASSSNGHVRVLVNNTTDKLTITGVSKGTATVTVTVTKDGYKDDQDTFTVTVKESCGLTSISDQTVTVGGTTTVTAPANCRFGSATSRNTNIATVRILGNGAQLEITGVAAGSTVLDVSMSGRDIDVSVTVVQPDPVCTGIIPSQGKPDTTTTIRGVYFGTVKGSVSFAGGSAEINSWGDTSISVQVPGYLSEGRVSVTVTTFNNKSCSVNFWVLPQPVQRDEEEECEDRKDCPEGGGGEETGEEGSEESGGGEGSGEEGSEESGDTEEDPDED